MHNLTFWDVLLTPVYLLILVSIAKKQRDKRYPKSHPLYKYYMPGLYAKLFGAVFIALIYEFYYKGGDTFLYYQHAQIVNSALNDSFTTWFQLIFHYPISSNPHLYSYVSQMYWYNDPSAYKVVVFTAIFGLFNST